MNNELTKQMKCAIGEQLVNVQLLAQGWPTVNANSTIKNNKGTDLFCQHGIDSNEIIGVQVKTTFQGENANISVGLTNKQAANIDELEKRITTPWVFVNVKRLNPLEVDYYILTAKQLRNVLYGLHQWYLYGWQRRPCNESLVKGPAGIRIAHILGNKDKSRFSDTCFDNPMVGIETKDKWENLWIKD